MDRAPSRHAMRWSAGSGGRSRAGRFVHGLQRCVGHDGGAALVEALRLALAFIARRLRHGGDGAPDFRAQSQICAETPHWMAGRRADLVEIAGAF